MCHNWHVNPTYKTVMGERGRLVVPSELRERHGLHPGTALVIVDSPEGVLIMSRQEARAFLRRDLQGVSLVDELLAERRREAAAEPGEKAGPHR